jgi:hypothetical protein
VGVEDTMKMARPSVMLALAWLSAALPLVRSAVIQVGANPMEKVIELLDVLSKQIEEEGQQDAATYGTYTAYYNNQAADAEKIIKENADIVAELEADLKESEAFQGGKNSDLVDLANKVATDSAELDAAKEGRAKDRALFEKNEATFIESLDQLERALEVMAKQAPAAAAAASSASLLSIAKRLKTALTVGGEIPLSLSQRETLDSFMRTAQMSAEQKSAVTHKGHHSGPEEAAPSFFQEVLHSHGPYGAYASQGSSVVAVLQDLEVKVKAERDAALADEQNAKTSYETIVVGLETMVENSENSLAAIKSSISQSTQGYSQKEAALLEAQEIYKTESAALESLEAEFRSKTQAYQTRLSKRTDEGIAVHEAQRILSSEVAKSYIKQQSVGTSDAPAAAPAASSSVVSIAAAPAAAPSFLQSFEETSRSRPSGALSFLATSRSLRRSHADPFAKVKTMIENMLKKLKDKQASESVHAAWCDKETEKTALSQKKKKEDVQKMKDRLAALEADLTQTTSDIATLTGNLQDMGEAAAEALKIRDAEHAVAANAIKQYKDAAELLESACKTLKTYYRNKEGGGSEVDKQEFKERHGMGTGIIGILEIAIDDFNKLHDDTKEAEDAAEKDYKEMKNSNEVRTAVFEKDLEWKGRLKVKAAFDQSTMENDLKSYETELVAIDTYMKNLETSCTVQAPTFAEKKEKREAELASLKEALTYLSGSSSS